MSSDAWYYVKGKTGIDKARYGDDYEAPYYIDYNKFTPMQSLQLAQAAITRGKLGAGTVASLRSVWEAEGKPLGTFDAWLAFVRGKFNIMQ